MKKFLILIPLIAVLCICCTQETEIKVFSQKAGPWQTNSYLIYDSISNDAAIIDPCHPVDSLSAVVENSKLKLKYIFITHCHQDHISGVTALLQKFPDVKICYSKEEYDAFESYSDWRNLYAPGFVKAWSEDSSISALMDLDYSSLRAPDIFVKENQKFKLGNSVVEAVKIPGHSRGSVCYSLNKMIFTGDLILFNSAGYIAYKLGSKAGLIKSIKKLYELFPDETIIYAGHGPVSNIGREKGSNKAVSQEKINL